MIPAKHWNREIGKLRRNRPLILGGGGGGEWRHPWSLNATYLHEEETWSYTVKPGFVNGGEVEVEMDWFLAPRETRERIPESRTTVRAYLTEKPVIRVPSGNMRRIGAGSAPTGLTNNTATYEPVPDFFKAMGVEEPGETTFDPISGFQSSISGVAGGDPDEQRSLYAFDVVLVQERAATTTAWTGGSGLDGTFAQFDVTYRSAPDRMDLPYIKTDSTYTPVDNPSEDPLLRLQGDWSDSGVDELHLGTVFLLSPTGVRGEPDSRWTPYYQHKLFWNLNHATNFLPASKPDTNLRFPLPLAGGVAQPTVNQILATVNDEVDRLTDFLNTNTLTGRFWTT